MFRLTMKLMSVHSAMLQSLGFSKQQVRDYSPVHHLLALIAFNLCK